LRKLKAALGKTDNFPWIEEILSPARSGESAGDNWGTQGARIGSLLL
jgi:hypothetical protein